MNGHPPGQATTATEAQRAQRTVRSPVVEFEGVEKTFNPGTPQAFTAIKDVSFRVDDEPGRGEFIALIGPSGCGKSTILNLIQGFSDVYPPTRGEVRVRGKPVRGPGRDRGMVVQKYSSFPNRTVLRNVTFGLEVNRRELGLDREQRDDLARQWLAKVGLAGHEHKYPSQLSGGQQQLVGVARAIIAEPTMILADEPTGSLHSSQGRMIMDLLKQLNAEGTTIIQVTHNEDYAAYGNRIIQLRDGWIVEE